jgi:hypothetical protein
VFRHGRSERELAHEVDAHLRELAIGALAWVPARRTRRIQPMIALRHEQRQRPATDLIDGGGEFARPRQL